MKLTTPSTASSIRTTYLQINLTEMLNPYSENYKILFKEIKEGTKNGQIAHNHGSEDIMLLGWQYFAN